MTIFSALIWPRIKQYIGMIPWQIWAALAAIIIIWAAYHKGASDKNKEWIDNLKQAEAKAEIKSLEAAALADDGDIARSNQFEKEQTELEKVIDDAKANNDNALDAIFGSM